MSKFKDLIIDIESCISSGDAFENIVSFVQTSIDCDEKTATDLVFEVEGQLYMDDEKAYFEHQVMLMNEFSEEGE